MSTNPSPQEVAAIRRALRPLREAVQAGDADAFRAELFADEPGVVSAEMADRLRYGFFAPMSTLDNSWSFAELCFHSEQPGMLRIALESRRPEMVDGRTLDSDPAWRLHLCTRHRFTQFAACSLAGLAFDFCSSPVATSFAELVLEFDPDDVKPFENARMLQFVDEGGLAVFRAARMRMRIRQAEAEAQPATSPTPHRRQRMV